MKNVQRIREYLLVVNKEFDKYGESNGEDINEIVPLKIMLKDRKFHDYLLCSNNLWV